MSTESETNAPDPDERCEAGRLLCRPGNPYSEARRKPGVYWSHEQTEEVGDQQDGYPSGDIVTIRCKVCGVTWRTELPQ